METIHKRKHHFNIVDIILLLLILAIISGGILFWIVNNRNLGSYPNMTYKVTIGDIPLDVAPKLEAGMPVYDDITGKQIGTLSAFSYTTDTDTKDLFLEISCAGILNTDHYYQIDSYTISVGKSVSVRVGNFWGKGVCTALTPGEQEA